MINNIKTEIDFDNLIHNFENKLSIKLINKPNFALYRFDKGKFAGTSNDGSTIFLNSIYFSYENGKYYVNSKNEELLKMRIIHELMHVMSSKNGKSGITSDDKKYKYNTRFGSGYIFDINDALNEGITQMFTDELINKTTNRFCDGYYDYKKIAQLLKYVFGNEVMIDSYFNNSGLLEKRMNDHCPHLFEIINKKLTFANYIDSQMLHSDIDSTMNADLKIEKDICKTLREQSFNECLELIIDNLIIPQLKDKKPEEQEDEVKKLFEIFNDNITVKNKVMYYLLKGYKKDNNELYFKKSQNDDIVSNIISVNNSGEYEILDDGNIIQKETGKEVSYDEQLYEYMYSKTNNKEYWDIIDFIFRNNQPSNNRIFVKLDNKTIKQRRIIMMTLKQFMKKNNLIILNDIDFLDTGTQFELNYINEKLTMNDILYLIHNYSIQCLPNNNMNVLQVIDKRTNRAVTSNSLISKCKLAYKISSLGLGSSEYQEQWEQFSNIAEKQISETGMIKKSPEYINNPFLSLFNDAYGCEWFYNYMIRIPIKFDRATQDLYLSENEMNQSLEQNEEQNKEFSTLFSTFAMDKNNSRYK